MQLTTLLKVIDLLSRPEGVTKMEIAETLDVSERQVYRIFNNIEDLGFPLSEVETDFEKKKRWKLLDSYVNKLPNINIPDIKLTLSEIITLYLLKGEERLYRGTDIEKAINSAFGKIGMLLPEKTADQLKKIKTLFVPTTKFSKDYSGKEEIIEIITDAILERKTCYVKYHSFYDDKIKNFKIDPLHFFERDGGLYFFIRSPKFKNIRTLAVERIQSLEQTDETFNYPEDFKPEELLESAFDIVFGDPIDFKIWFSANQARYIKQRTWSKTQSIEAQSDGSIILSMTTSGMWDVKRWVLSYGAEAKVLKPEELKEEIVEEFQEALKRY